MRLRSLPAHAQVELANTAILNLFSQPIVCGIQGDDHGYRESTLRMNEPDNQFFAMTHRTFHQSEL